MKVIKLRSLTNDWPKRCVCEECGAELEYMPDDVHIGWMGIEYVTCSECGGETGVGDGKRKAKPTWPLTFHHICKDDGAKGMDEEAVNEMADKVVKVMQNSADKYDFTAMATGDTMVVGWKCADGIDIYVTKDYWADTIFND